MLNVCKKLLKSYNSCLLFVVAKEHTSDRVAVGMSLQEVNLCFQDHISDAFSLELS